LSRGVELVACATCGGAADRDEHGKTRGERLLRQLDDAVTEGDAGVSLSSVRCLWACKRSCAVHVRSPGRAGYVLVELEPTAESARALLDYAVMYGASSDGAVPFKQWPQPLRGHFLCRLPPTDNPSSPLAVTALASAHVAPRSHEEEG
jgi:predicted metal-binding protein